MTREVGFIGDIHGALRPLEQLVAMARTRVDALVFLGDYVNRGSQSREVIDYLIALPPKWPGSCTFLLGHHDLAFLRALGESRLDEFLRMGGAATLSSYPRVAAPGVKAALHKRVPVAHVEFLRDLHRSMGGTDFVAAHAPDLLDEPAHGRFEIFGHYPQKNLTPRIGTSCALIDTGCGTFADGKLTCFLWPSRSWFQST